MVVVMLVLALLLDLFHLFIIIIILLSISTCVTVLLYPLFICPSLVNYQLDIPLRRAFSRNLLVIVQYHYPLFYDLFTNNRPFEQYIIG